MPEGKGTYDKPGRPKKKKAKGNEDVQYKFFGGPLLQAGLAGLAVKGVGKLLKKRKDKKKGKKDEAKRKVAKEREAQALGHENLEEMQESEATERPMPTFGDPEAVSNQQGEVVEQEEYKEGGEVKGLKKWLSKARLKKAYRKEGRKLVKEGTLKKGRAGAYARKLAKKEAPKSGVIRKGAITDKSTKTEKGGEYVKYKKGSEAAGSFKEAFAKARKAGDKTFTWDGRSYAAVTKEDVAKKKAASKSKPVDKSLAPSPDYTGPKDKLKENIESYQPKKTEQKKEPERWNLKKKEPEKGTTSAERLKDIQSRRKFNEGGKVEASNPFGWPSTDASKRKG